MVKAYFQGRNPYTYSLCSLLAIMLRPPLSPSVCGIIVSGRTCILMEMDSTAINISKYIQRVRLSYSHLPCVQVCVCQRVCVCGSLRARRLRFKADNCQPHEAYVVLSVPFCNGVIIRWAGSLWFAQPQTHTQSHTHTHTHSYKVKIHSHTGVSKKNGSFNLNANTFGLASGFM